MPIKMFIYTMYFPYKHMGTLYLILYTVMYTLPLCSCRRPEISVFVQMVPIIIITTAKRPQISWRSIFREGLRAHTN